MKLFMILMMGTHIGGYAGPLPYGEFECMSRAADLNATAIDKGVDIRAKCEWRDAPPVIVNPTNG